MLLVRRAADGLAQVIAVHDVGCPNIVWICTRSGPHGATQSHKSAAESRLVGVVVGARAGTGVAAGDATEVVDG